MSIDLGKVTMKERLGRGGGMVLFLHQSEPHRLTSTEATFFGSSSCLRKDAGNLEVCGREGESRKKGFWRVSILLPTDGDSPRCPLSSPISGWTWPLQHEKKVWGKNEMIKLCKLRSCSIFFEKVLTASPFTLSFSLHSFLREESSLFSIIVSFSSQFETFSLKK